MTQPLNSVGGFSVGVGNARTTVIAANGTITGSVAAANIVGTVPNANYAAYAFLATYANTANTVSGANVSGVVANATYSDTANYALTANVANVANSVTGANITGEVANANFATYSAYSNTANTANVANTANSVTIANVTGITTLSQEIHVDPAGSDTTGDGSILRPYKTITKGVNMASGSAIKVVVHNGGYYEDVTLANVSQLSIISSATAGVSSPSTPMIYGNLTLSGNTSVIAVGGIAVSDTITHSASGSFYYTGAQLGASQFTGTLNKTGSGYLALMDINAATGNGANFTSFNITGNGPVTMSNVTARNVTINNSSVSVTVTNDSSLSNTTVTAGTLNAFDTFLYSNANTTAALTTSNGVINLKNVTALTPFNTPARLNISPTTVLAYDDIYFDRANSNVGFGANIVADFQSIRAANTVTATTLTGSLTTNAQPNITSVGTLTSLAVSGNITVTGNVLPATGNTYNLGSPTLKWANLYVGPNSIFIQDTANANLNAELQVTNGILYINGAQGVSANIVNGTSNVIVASNGNVTISSAGTANVLTVSNTGVTTTNLTVSGNINGVTVGNTVYGIFWSNTTQSNPGANTAAAITWNNQDGTNGTSYSGSNITIARAGTYNVQFNAQVNHPGGGQASGVYFWAKLDGTDVPGSAGYFTSGSNTVAIQSWNTLISANANSNVQIYWAPRATDITLTAYANTSWHPDVPSALITIVAVGA